MAKRPIFWRLYPSYLFIIVITVLALSWFSLRAQRTIFLERTSSDLKARALLVQNQIAAHVEKGDYQAVDSLCKKLGDISATRITVILPSGEVIGDTEKDPADMENHGNRPEIVEAIKDGAGEQIRYSSTVEQRLMYRTIVFEIDGQPAGVIRMAIPLTFIDQVLTSSRMRVILDGIIIAILSAAVGLYVSRRLSKPLERLKLGAQRFAAGDLQRKMLIEGQCVEIDALAEAMNEMAGQLGQRIATITNQRNEQEAILLSMVEGVIAIDTDGLIINLNRAAAEFFGLNIDECVGKPLHNSIRSSALHDTVNETIRTRRAAMAEVEMARGAKKKIAEVTSSLLRGADGRQLGVLIVVNDVTQMRQLEKIRRDFVANVSHELKTPITAIHGFVETLKDGAVENIEDAHRFLDIISKQSNRLQAIIEDLLSLARIEQGADEDKIELMSKPIAPILKDAILSCQQKAEAKNIQLELSADSSITALVNPRLLEQAIINLIDNAITYSNQGDVIKVKANVFSDEVAISVIDTGCGISKEHHTRLFERFYRVDKARSRDHGGTGLGLAIVKHIVLAHNGRISVESEIGQGSMFTIQLPK
ncbi:MAG: ATP-binding protein [Candidatus Zixiibacteriota bacterium]